MEETYKRAYEWDQLDHDIQDEIDGSSSQNREVINIKKSGCFNDDDPKCVTNMARYIENDIIKYHGHVQIEKPKIRNQRKYYGLLKSNLTSQLHTWQPGKNY